MFRVGSGQLLAVSAHGRLVRKIRDNLDFLIGSVSTKGLKYEAYNLTTKVDGVTRTKHIPRNMVDLVRRMTGRHRQLKQLIKELGETNWLLLREGVELRDDGMPEASSVEL